MGILKQVSAYTIILTMFGFHIATLSAAEKKRTDSAYQKYQDRIVALQLQYKSLKKAYEELNQQYNDLKYQNGQLSWKIKELSQWNRRLHKGYGPGIWQITDADTPEFKFKSQSGDVKEVIQDLNVVFRDKKYPQIVLKKLENNTAVLTLDKPYALSDKMGATGADYYIKEVLYTVTSADNVDCIHLNLSGKDKELSKKSCR